MFPESGITILYLNLIGGFTAIPGILYAKVSLRKIPNAMQDSASLVHEVANWEFICATGVVDGQTQTRNVAFLHE